MKADRVPQLILLSSFEYPSQHAHPIHGYDMARAFADHLGGDFLFVCGGTRHGFDLSGSNARVPFPRAIHWLRKVHLRAPAFALWFLFYSWGITSRGHQKPWVYLIDPYLALVLIFLKPIGRFRIAFEGHHVYSAFLRAIVYRFADSYLFITSSLLNELGAKYRRVRERGIVIPSAVNLELYANSSEDMRISRGLFRLPIDAFIAMYVGSVGLYSWKGTDIFLAAEKYIETDRILFVVAGVKEADRAAWERAYESRRIRFFSWIERKDIPHIMNCADVLVLPNKKGDMLSERYTSPMKLFEYMASSKPIIASDLPSVREILNENNALFVRPDDPAELARAILSVQSNREVARLRAERARKDVEAYSWKERVVKILSHLQLKRDL